MAKNTVVSQEDELLKVQNRIKELEDEKAVNSNSQYLKEIQDLQKAQTQGNSNISIKPIQGDKHISMWHVSGHNIGKRVGPIHPGGAQDIFLQFEKAGIRLSLTKPTPELIETYKKTKEYKDAEAKEIKRRAAKNRSNSESQIEKLTQAIAKSQGIRPEDVNRIKDQSEVMAR